MEPAKDRDTRARWSIFGGIFFLFLALLNTSGTYELAQLAYSRSTFLPWLNLGITLALYLLSVVFFWKAKKIKKEAGKDNQSPE